MDLPDYLKQLYEYNYWANHRVLSVAETLTEQQLFEEQGFSWGSIYAVLLHMMGARWLWLRRWQGESLKSLPEQKDFPDLFAILNQWTLINNDVNAFIAAQTTKSLQTEVSYKSTAGKPYKLPLWQMMIHVASYDTFCRGEVSTMFTLVNANFPEVDWIQYFLEKSGQK